MPGPKPDQIDRLTGDLTPMGSERAGNAAGTIPAWTGGITSPPSDYVPGQHETDPFREDEVLFRIDASNYQQYADQLSVGPEGHVRALSGNLLHERLPDAAFSVVSAARLRHDRRKRQNRTAGGRWRGCDGRGRGLPVPVPGERLRDDVEPQAQAQGHRRGSLQQPGGTHR